VSTVWLITFWLMQAVAQILFKYGTTVPSRHTFGFVAGNVFGASSIWFLMNLYKTMNPNVALGLGTGGGFLCAQLALVLIFKSAVSPLQYGAMALVSVGMAMFATGMKQ
jgi:multidrug transporter EmrE-like cation transporter